MSDIALQPGEQLISVSAGDTVGYDCYETKEKEWPHDFTYTIEVWARSRIAAQVLWTMVMRTFPPRTSVTVQDGRGVERVYHAYTEGTADLTEEAQRIIDRIALSAMSPDSSIKVTGHTDDVPISNGQFRDNWDLGAGRAASVVQAIQNTGLIAGDRLEAVSKGEMEPVADNTTAAGREKNRRIEIEISYEN